MNWREEGKIKDKKVADVCRTLDYDFCYVCAPHLPKSEGQMCRGCVDIFTESIKETMDKEIAALMDEVIKNKLKVFESSII